MNILKKLLLCSLFSTSITVYAAPATSQQITQLMKITDVEKITQDSFKQLKPVFQQQANSIVLSYLQKEKLNSEEQKVANEFANKMYQLALKSTDFKTLLPLLEKVYGEVFTAQEIQAQIDFYSTPEGQSILSKTPLLTKKVMEITNSRLMQSMTSTETEFTDIKKMLETLKKNQK